MNLSNLKPAEGSVKDRRRVGRGQGSGKGGTSKRGHKGAQSRSGYKRKIGFEGGQMPLYRRVPKRGFKNINRVEYTALNLDRLQAIADKFKVNAIDPAFLAENKIIAKTETIKILGRGNLNAKLDVIAHAFSDAASKAIEEQGGTATIA